MADQTNEFDLQSHQQMWHTFTKIATYGAVGVAGLLVFLAIVVL